MGHRIGIIGAGNISARYLSGLRRYPELSVEAVSDLDLARAESLAREFDVRTACSPEELLASGDVDVVVNLTPPAAHAATVLEALEAGKSVYVEKPLATTREDGQRMLAAADRASGLLGSAPDTFLGSAGQTARAAIDDGAIGEPVGATAFVRSSRAETWHPDPRFLYSPGGGPVMDMGPYYVAALVNCLGPVRSVSAASRIGAPTREVTAPGRLVGRIEVTVPTHVGAVLTLESGVICTTQFSFDVWDTTLPRIEIYGTEGTLILNDPNIFDGDVLLRRHGDTEWRSLDPVTDFFGAPGTPQQYERGLGVRDLARAIDGAPLRVSPEFAFHVLDTLLTIEEAAQAETTIHVATTIVRPMTLVGEPTPL